MLEPVLDRRARGLSGRHLIVSVSAIAVGMFGEYMRIPGALGYVLLAVFAYLWHQREKARQEAAL